MQRLEGIDRLVLLGDTIELRHGPARDALAAAEPRHAGDRRRGRGRGRGRHRAGQPRPCDSRPAGWTGGGAVTSRRRWRSRSACRRPAPPGSPSASPDFSLPRTSRSPIRASGCATTCTQRTGTTSICTSRSRRSSGSPPASCRAWSARSPIPRHPTTTRRCWRRSTRSTRRARSAVVRAACRSAGAPRPGPGARWPAAAAGTGCVATPCSCRSARLSRPPTAPGSGPLQADDRPRGPAQRRARRDRRGRAPAANRTGPPRLRPYPSHRPLPGDDGLQWRTPSGIELHNCGNWIFQTLFMGRGPDGTSPYWPGGAILLDDEGPPRLERLLGDVPAKALRPARP